MPWWSARCPAWRPEGMSITPAPPYGQFPIYNFDIQHEHGIPADVITLSNAMLAADGVVIVSAEYNFTIPSGLKNASTGSRASRSRRLSPTSLSPSSRRQPARWAVRGCNIICARCFVALMLLILNKPENFIGNAKSKVDEQKRELTDEVTRDFIRKQLANFAKFIEQVRVKA